MIVGGLIHGGAEKQLLESIASVIQRTKPEDNVPREPYTYTTAPATAALALPAPKSKAATKGKQPAKSTKQPSAAPTTDTAGATVFQAPNGRVPKPPVPLPPLTARVSPYSPLLPANVLVETVKAGMNTIAEPGAPAAAAAGAAKGKKKVIRVRQ
jgi:signal recognition particle subunit SRP19